MSDKIFLEGLEVACRIGIFDWERKIRQHVLIDLEFPAEVRRASRRDRIEDAVDYKKIAKHTIAFVARSEFYLIETLTEKLAQSLLRTFRLPEIRLRVAKPGAIRGAKTVGVEIVRKRR